MPIQVDLETTTGEALQAAQLGFAAQLLLHSPRRTFAMASLSAWLVPPIRLGQVAFVFDRHGGQVRAFRP